MNFVPLCLFEWVRNKGLRGGNLEKRKREFIVVYFWTMTSAHFMFCEGKESFSNNQIIVQEITPQEQLLVRVVTGSVALPSRGSEHSFTISAFRASRYPLLGCCFF